MSVSVVLKVYFLLAKKLKQKAEVVEIIFADIAGKPKDFNKNNIPKSINVLAPPTAMKRSFVWLFLLATSVVFLNKVKRAIFGLIEYSANVFADNS